LPLSNDEEHLVTTLLEHRVAGLALLTPLMPTRQLQRVCNGWPTVVIGRVVTSPGIDVVTTDEDDAARHLVAYLVGLGHRDIVHISGGDNRPAKDRAAAYRRAMTRAGLTPREVNASFTEQGGQLGGKKVVAMKPLPTAVIAANDLIAVGAMGVFRSAGLRVPDDISVVGYDDSQIAQLDLLQLTSVRQSTQEFGTATISLLTERIHEGRTSGHIRRVPASLIERSTTGPARRKR
jgi:DNA-binding LacI/PurR family transcriptional regulator